MSPVSSRHRQTESAAGRAPAGTTYRGEQVTLHNHDHRTGYGLGIRLSRPDGTVIERTDHYLGSGTTTRLFGICDPGPVHLEVAHAGRTVAETAGHLDDSPAGTVRIECGNGVVTATIGR
jgi:hypothetical protein